MKINDIITENAINWEQEIKHDISVGSSGVPGDQYRGLNIKQAAIDAQAAYNSPKGGRIKNNAIDIALKAQGFDRGQPASSQAQQKQQKQKAKPTSVFQKNAQSTDRTRKDVKGRNLKHDRYYRDKQDDTYRLLVMTTCLTYRCLPLCAKPLTR